eukprot:2882845-Pleurochrysis_carterae.AAC.3
MGRACTCNSSCKHSRARAFSETHIRKYGLRRRYLTSRSCRFRLRSRYGQRTARKQAVLRSWMCSS